MAVRITAQDRRRRLVARHRLDRTARDVVEAVSGLIAVHSSDPATPYLSSWARVAGFTGTDLESALFENRVLWRMHAMRRTLFVVAFDDGAMLDAAVGRTNAARERKRLEQWLARDLKEGRFSASLADFETAILELLADGDQYRTTELADAVPALRTEFTVGRGKWAARVPLASRLLLIMSMEGRIVRARPAGTWRSSQYAWAATAHWFEEQPPVLKPAAARAMLLTRYLAAFGPATLTDIRWWTGWTARDARGALAMAGADPVELDEGAEGFVVPGDFDSPRGDGDAVALLPGLDSTPMGWKERSWYLGDHAGPLFDRNGNVGPTVWVDGHIVGGWGQRPDGTVVHRLLEEVGAAADRRISARVDELTAWLDGTVVTPRFQAPLERELST